MNKKNGMWKKFNERKNFENVEHFVSASCLKKREMATLI